MRKAPSRRFRVDPEVLQASAWRDKWSLRTLRRYSGKWVAIRGRKIIAFADTYGALHRRIDELKPGPVYVTYEGPAGLVVG